MASSSPVLLMLAEKLYTIKNKSAVCENFKFEACVGSSHGWLVVLDEQANPFLFDPLSRTRIRLPGTMNSVSINSSKIDKVVLCGTPSISHHHNYMVIVMCTCWFKTKLAFCRHGDKEWTNLESDADQTFYDVVCCDQTNTLLTLGPGPCVHVWDLNQSVPKKKILIQDSCPRKLKEEGCQNYPKDLYASQWYLAVSPLGEIYIVVRYIGEFVRPYDGKVVYEGDTLTDYASEPLVCPYRTLDFHVFKLHHDDGNNNFWKDVDRSTNYLNGYAMFLGGNQSTMMVHSELMRNAIYFTDDYWDRMNEDYSYGGHDMGIFDIEEATIHPLFDDEQDHGRIEPPPFWIIPNHC